MDKHCVFIATFVLMIIHLVQAQDQTGFINLACGLYPDKSPYHESSTGLIYSSDNGLVQSKKVGRVQAEFEKFCTEPYWTLRYFPDGVRNCYTLNVTRDTRYLIKATFVYGNYDGLNANHTFDLYLGPNIWTTVTNNDHHIIKEIIHVTKSNSIQICLVKKGTSIPFINALELRPLRKDMYATKSGSIKSLFRASLNNSTSRTRYPNDVYDREWHPIFLKEEWASVTTTRKVNTSNGYDIPQDVMSKAATSLNASGGMNITWEVDSPTKEIYIFLHFAELQAPHTREFYVRTWNISSVAGPYIPTFLAVTTINITELSQCEGGKCVLEVVNTSNSKLPPLISAIEAFTEIDLSQLETNGDDVTAIKNILSTYGLSNDSWQGDPCVPKQFLWNGLKCSGSDMSNPPMITSLNLSSTGLNGTIALTIQNLTNLRELDLSNNNLVGGVPEFLADMKLLLDINLSGNNLTGQVPQKLIKKKLLKLNVEGNSKLHCTVGSCVNKGGEGAHKENKFILWVVASIAFVIVFIVALILFLVFRKRKPLNGEASALEPTSRSLEPDITTNNKRFTYLEVMTITNNFQRILGRGGFGIVYYGSMNGTEEVAVKVLSHSSSQGYKQFKAEVELLLRVHHKNLVSLVGYCDEGDELALIYEYMANGNLGEHMSGKRGGSFLSWGTRLKIAAESAQGLEYLHNGCKPLMVHRDIKTTNILLNEHFEAKLADFGLSRTFPTEDNSHVSTVVAGTIGYIDPEYYRTNWLTEKSDVYSFGIVLLEIITNQPVIDQKREKPYIAEWVGLMLTKGDIKSIIDSNLHGDYDSGSFWKVVEVAMSCVNPSSAKRPTMTQVLFELNECLVSSGEGSRMMDSQSSIEMSITYGTEVNPMAR